MNKDSTQRFQASGNARRASAVAVGVASLLIIGSATAVGVGTMTGSTATAISAMPRLDAAASQPLPLATQAGPVAAATVTPAKETGSFHQAVSPPVPLNATVTLVKGGKIRISSIETVQGEARGRGEVAGPSLRFQVTIDNPTDEAISTEGMLVNVESGSDSTPSLQLSGPGVAEFPASVPPRGSAFAVYVFNVAPARRDRVRILFDYGLTEPIAVFEGSAGKPGA
jgi:hypothetical protein